MKRVVMVVDLQSKSAFAVAQKRFDAAAEVVGLADDTRRVLRETKRELTVHFPIRHDDGSVRRKTGAKPASPQRSGRAALKAPPGLPETGDDGASGRSLADPALAAAWR